MSRTMKFALLMLTLTVAMAAVAADGAAKFSTSTPFQLNGKQLNAGDYKLTWTGSGDDVQVTFKSGKADVATAKAKLVERAAAPAANALVTDNGAVKEIRMAGRKSVLVFGD